MPKKAPYQYGSTMNFYEFRLLFSSTKTVQHYIGTEVIWEDIEVISVHVVERTLAWLNRCRRLAKDWEKLNLKALAFFLMASIRFMLRKLCNPT